MEVNRYWQNDLDQLYWALEVAQGKDDNDAVADLSRRIEFLEGDIEATSGLDYEHRSIDEWN